MIIDLILDRKAGDNYQPDHFYRECMEYSSIFDGIGADICEAMDYGTEDDVRKALCAYVTSNDYNPAICDYINSVSWLEETDDLDLAEDQATLIAAMEAAGYYFDGLDSSDTAPVFNGNWGTRIWFNGGWPEVEAWLEGVVFDDPEVSEAVERILHPERF